MSLLTVPGFGEVYLTRAERRSDPMGDFRRAFSGQMRSDSRPVPRSWSCQTVEMEMADARALEAALNAPRAYECSGDLFAPVATNGLRFRNVSWSYLTDGFAVLSFEAHETKPLSALLRWESGYPVAGTFARASVATYRDQYGVLQEAASGEARTGHYVEDAVTGLTVPGWLLELARTGRLDDPDDIDAASWTETASPTIASARSIISGSSARRITATATGSLVEQASGTLTGSDEVVSAIIEKDTANPSETVRLSLIDATGATTLATGTFDTTTGVLTVVTGAGSVRTLMELGPNGGTVWLVQLTASGTASNLRQARFHPDNSGSNGGVYVHYVNVEDGLSATSPIVGAAATARAVETLSRPLPAGAQLPTDPHARYIRWQHIANPISSRVAQNGVGTGSAVSRLTLYWQSSSSLRLNHANGTTTDEASVTVSVSPGDIMEALEVWYGDGTGTLIVSVNGGAVSSATLSGITPASSWNGGAVTYLNSRDSGNNAGAMTLLRDYFIPRTLTGTDEALMAYARQF